MSSYVPALNLYGMLSDVGDNIIASQERRKQDELDTLYRKQASAALGSDVLPPKPEGFIQRLTRTIAGEPEPSTQTPQPVVAGPVQAAPAPVQPQTSLPMLASTPGIVADELQKRGYSPAHIAGILGNLKAESNFNTGAIGDSGTSGGLAQWHNERLTGLKNFAAQQGVDWRDPRIQTAYLDYELKNKEPRAYAALQAAQTPQEAAKAFLGFERPQGWAPGNPMGVPSAQARINNAVQLAGPIPSSTGAKLADGYTNPNAQAPAATEAMKGWPKGLQTLPEIMSAMQNPYMKNIATKALEAYTKAAGTDDNKLEKEYDAKIKIGQKAGLSGQELQDYALGTHGASNQTHVVGNALVDSKGKVLYQGQKQEEATSLSPEAIDNAARRELAGDTSWKVGLGRGAQGSANLTAVQNRMAQIQKERNSTPEDILNNVAKFGGQKAGARTAGQMSAKLDILSGTVASASKFATELSNQFPRGSFVPLNKLEQMGQSAMSDPKLAAFKAATNTLVNEYARAVGGGVGTDSSREHAREMLSTAQSPEAFAAVTQVLQREVEIAHSAARDRLNAGTGETKAAAPSEAKKERPKLGSVTIKPAAAQYLKDHPELRNDFDDKYGDGASDTVLGPAKRAPQSNVPEM